jgi:dTDP-D-glucose 4,6-dehydratase
MMGTSSAVDSAEAAKAVVHISTDQSFVDEEDGDSKDSYKDPNNESATLDRAKEAAKEFVKAHPES